MYLSLVVGLGLQGCLAISVKLKKKKNSEGI
jgi:hypothetical protein